MTHTETLRRITRAGYSVRTVYAWIARGHLKREWTTRGWRYQSRDVAKVLRVPLKKGPKP